MSVKNKLKLLMQSRNTVIKIVSRIAYSVFMKSRIVFDIRYRPHMEDEKYIKHLYKKRFGVEPNLVNPQNFNEKNNWRKLYDRQEIYTDMVDKYKLKQFVESELGVGYTIPILGVWENANNIDFDELPNKFVLKANHAGGVIVCRDKETFDKKKAIKELNQTLKLDYYFMSREWPYKNVKRLILCEAYMGENLTEYKNYCFNGKLAYTFVWKNISRDDGRKPDPFFCGAYDRNWSKTNLEIDYPSKLDEYIEKPMCYDKLVLAVEKISTGIPFVRIDCFIINNSIYIGEMTFFPWGGFQKFKDEKWNMILGEMEMLPGIDY